MEAVCFLLQNMNYIERVVRVAFFLNVCILAPLLEFATTQDMKMVSEAFLFDKVQTEKTEAEKSDASKRI